VLECLLTIITALDDSGFDVSFYFDFRSLFVTFLPLCLSVLEAPSKLPAVKTEFVTWLLCSALYKTFSPMMQLAELWASYRWLLDPRAWPAMRLALI
jgi:hypothetical protein